MAGMAGWNKIFKDITEWKYYKKPNIFKLYFHLFTNASIKPVRVSGCWVPRGGLLFKENKIGEECGLTYQQVRTAIKKLEEGGEIKKETYNKFTIVTLINYDKYLSKGFTNNADETDEYDFYNELEGAESADNEPEPKKKKGKSKEDKERELAEIMQEIEELRSRYSDGQLKIVDEFFTILISARRGGRIADSVILKAYRNFDKYPQDKVAYGMHRYIHNPNLHDKKENYVLGIIRNATAEEVERYKKEIKGGNPQSQPSSGHFKNSQEKSMAAIKEWGE